MLWIIVVLNVRNVFQRIYPPHDDIFCLYSDVFYFPFERTDQLLYWIFLARDAEWY